MFMLGFNEPKDQLAMANSACWCCHALKRDDSHFLREALDFEVEGQGKKRRLNKI